MKIQSILVVCILFLSACASTPRLPSGKLDNSYTDVPVETKLLLSAPDKPYTRSLYTKTSTPSLGGGLVGALVSASITAASNANAVISRKGPFEEMSEMLHRHNDNDKFMRVMGSIIEQARWIKVNSTHLEKSDDKKELKRIGDQLRASMTEPTMTVLATEFLFGEYFDYLRQNLKIQIMTVADGEAKQVIYHTNVSSYYRPDGVAAGELENYKIWLKNDGQIMKEALAHTSSHIRKSLTNRLKDYVYDEPSSEK